jgi:hypothetical protein
MKTKKMMLSSIALLSFLGCGKNFIANQNFNENVAIENYGDVQLEKMNLIRMANGNSSIPHPSVSTMTKIGAVSGSNFSCEAVWDDGTNADYDVSYDINLSTFINADLSSYAFVYVKGCGFLYSSLISSNSAYTDDTADTNFERTSDGDECIYDTAYMPVSVFKNLLASKCDSSGNYSVNFTREVPYDTLEQEMDNEQVGSLAVYVYGSGIKDGQTKELYIDCNNNYTKEQIVSSISAQDLFGVACSVNIISGSDTFNPQNIGVYTLKLQATDSYGQTATATLIVHIVDYDKPVISSKKTLSFTADKGQILKYSDIASTYISITDNGTSHGSSLSYDYTYDNTAIDSSWSKTFVASDYGQHILKVHARDGSGNETTQSFTISVADGTAPVITRKDGQDVSSIISIGVSKTFTMTLADITQMFKATDNVDGDVSSTLTGVSDSDNNFFTNNHKVGSYSLTIKASDKNSNVATQVVSIKIVADIPPVFIIGDTIVYTDTATPLTINQLNSVVTNAILSDKENVSAMVIDDGGYVGNESTAGTYHVTYQYTENATTATTKNARRFMANDSDMKTGSFDLVVSDSKNDSDEDKEVNAFVGFFQKLKNWFRGVFTKFKFDCFITDKEWNDRFGTTEDTK